MYKAALSAADELISINNGLLRNETFDNGVRSTLAKVIDEAIVFYPEQIRLMLDAEAAQALVPASQFHLIIGELVRNAIKAKAAERAIEISIRARIRRRRIFRKWLQLEVIDNGIGMTKRVEKNAVRPFFSTRAGTHLGLGLTGVVDNLKASMGQLHIKSTAGVGTVIRIDFPL